MSKRLLRVAVPAVALALALTGCGSKSVGGGSASFIEMVSSPSYMKSHEQREGGLERTVLIAMREIQPGWSEATRSE